MGAIVKYLALRSDHLKVALATKIKIMALAVIYILHVAFFDVLMNHAIFNNTEVSVVKHSLAQTHHSTPERESAYRLLTKHEESKQIQTTVPVIFDFVATSVISVPEKLTVAPQFCGLPYNGGNGNKLYRIFRSFLI